MNQDRNNMSRRGILRGEWIKIIRDRGIEEIEKEPIAEPLAEPEFKLKPAKGRARRGGSFVQRPPHAVPESEFLAGCTKCDACIQACPPHAIFRAPDSDGQLAGFPIINSETQPCLMCDDLPCVPACEVGVLRLTADLAMGLACINPETCLPFNGTVCTACVERCPVEKALTIEAGRPVVHADSCTGCGVCLYVCPGPDETIQLVSHA